MVPEGCICSQVPDDSDASWYEGLLCDPLLSATVAEKGCDNWWLVDSGASVNVISEESLKGGCFRVLDETILKDGPKFFAANGTEVVMTRQVTVQVFINLVDEKGKSVDREIKLSALVGNTSNNILSTTQLVERGWELLLSEKHRLIHSKTKMFAHLTSWAGCPWIYLGKEKTLNPLGDFGVRPIYKRVVVQYEVDEMHRARGHIPFDPNCPVCQKTKGVSQHRRKVDGTNVVEISADFFFIKDVKFLVICERFSGMVGSVWMSPNTDHVRAGVQKWLHEMGCLGDGTGILSVNTDGEDAVGNVFTHLQIGKDVRVSKAPPQGQAVNGSAERSVTAIKENYMCVLEELRSHGLQVCRTGI